MRKSLGTIAGTNRISSAGPTKVILEKLGHFNENISIELRADRCSGFRCSGVANF